MTGPNKDGWCGHCGRSDSPGRIVEEFQARVRVMETRYPDYDFSRAMERSANFIGSDRATRDADGKLITFGQTYIDTSNGNKIDAIGIDLRNHGWVIGWTVDNTYPTYIAVPSDRLKLVLDKEDS